MISFKEFLDEMKVIENKETYFLLPAMIPRLNKLKSIDDKVNYFRNVNEVIECMKFMFDEFLRGNDKIFTIRFERGKNSNLLLALGYDLDSPNIKKQIYHDILSKLTPEDFDKSNELNGSIAYIFKFKNIAKRLGITDPKIIKRLNKKHIYIKFQFIYKKYTLSEKIKMNAEILKNIIWNKILKDGNKTPFCSLLYNTGKYNTERDEPEYISNGIFQKNVPYEKKTKYVLIFPNQLIMNLISIHA